MYLQYFGLNEPPFSITPDPRFVYLSPRHEDALAHLQYGIGQGGSGGFVQLTGEVGTGKTTLCRTLLLQLPEDARVALILNPVLQPVELLEAICQEFQIDIAGADGSIKRLVDRLNAFLLATHSQGETAVLLIDEAQNLSPEALEQVRLLTNLETETKKLLQIILLGQPELRDVLARPDLRQLAQRVTARYHLTPLNRPETGIYIDHRLTVAGCPDSPFSAAAHRALHKHSGGVPRLINVIAERALLAAYAAGKREVNAALVKAAAHEVRGADHRDPGGWPRWAAVAAVVGLIGLSGWWWQRPAPLEPIEAAAATLPEQAPLQAPLQPEVEASGPAAASVEVPAAPALEMSAGRSMPASAPPELDDLAQPFDQAWQQLLALRNIERVELNQPDCAARVAPGLYCLRRRGTIDEIAGLNRPLLLQLPASGGFVVAEFDQLGAIVWSGDSAQALPSAELARRWNGRYWDTWAMPGYVPEVQREGERGPGVLWVKAAAARVGYAGDVSDPYFGPALTAWAQEFQQRVGVEADGLIGPLTLQHLSASQRDES